MLSELALREKIQYRRLRAAAKLPGATNLDLRVQRFKAVSHGCCLGYYSTLGLACASVDWDVLAPQHTGTVVWAESEYWSQDYVLDVQRGVYYTRKLKDPYPEGLKVVEAAA